MKTPICPTHKIEMNFVAGGIAKASGKPYGAFYGCPEKVDGKNCKESFNIPEKLGRLMTMEHQFTRDKGIAFFNSTNAAIALISSMMPILEKTDRIDKILELIKEHRDFFMAEWKAFYLKEIVLEEDSDIEELKAKLEKE